MAERVSTFTSKPVPRWLTYCLVLLSIVAFGLMLNIIRGNPLFAKTIDEIRSQPEVARLLGDDVKAGWYVLGQLRDGIDSEDGYALLSIPVSGTRGSGTVFVEAVKDNNNWRMLYLALEARDTGEQVELLKNVGESGYWRTKLR